MMCKKNKIAIITRENSIGNITLNCVIPEIIKLGYEPVLFVTGDPKIKGMENPYLQEASRIETAIYRNIAAPYLNANPLMANGQLLDGVNYTLDQLSNIYGFDILDLDNVNSSEFINYIKNAHNIIGGINIRGLNLFRAPIIKAFNEKDGGFFWNLHPGTLPEYKGLYIPFRAAIDGRTSVGQTLHHINEGIDEGNIIAIQSIFFDPKKPVFETYMDLAPIGANIVIIGLKHYKEFGNPKGSPQTELEKSSYSPLPSIEEMQNLAAAGTVFANKEDVARIYIDLYSRAGTPHANGLAAQINEAVFNTTPDANLCQIDLS